MKKIICWLLGHKLDNPWQYYAWHDKREWANKQVCLRCEYKELPIELYLK